MIKAAPASILRAFRIRPCGCSGVSVGSPRTSGMITTPVSKPDNPRASFGNTSNAATTIASGFPWVENKA